VTTGRANSNTGQTGTPGVGNPAGPGPDLATGNGLVDAAKAALTARVRCLGPIVPIRPPITPPIRPPITVSPPIQPPVRPPITPPVRPPITPPITVSPPIRPPITPQPPIRPPITPQPPIRPPITPPPIRPGPTDEEAAGLAGAEGTEGVLSAEEVAALEDLILESDVDLD
jgi:hypothetical protein